MSSSETKSHNPSTPTASTSDARRQARRPRWRRFWRRRAHGRIRCSTSSRRRWPGLPLSGAFGAMFFPGIKSFVQGDIPFLDGEVPAANGVVTARGLAKMYAAIANGGTIDDTEFLSEDLTQGLIGNPKPWPDLNVGVPMPFHLGYHESPIPGLLKGFGHIGLGGTTRVGRSGDGQRLRLRPQPAADADGARHGRHSQAWPGRCETRSRLPGTPVPWWSRNTVRATGNQLSRRKRWDVARSSARCRGAASTADRCRSRFPVPPRRPPGSRGSAAAR